MGNWFSSTNRPATAAASNLEKEVADLRAIIEELRQQSSGRNEVSDAIRVRELEKEVEALRGLNEEMHQKVRAGREHTLRAIGGGGASALKISSISREKLMAWVDDQLQNQDSNCTWIPDFAERKLKADIFAMLLGLVEHILETTKIEVMGHAIRFELTQE